MLCTLRLERVSVLSVAPASLSNISDRLSQNPPPLVMYMSVHRRLDDRDPCRSTVTVDNGVHIYTPSQSSYNSRIALDRLLEYCHEKYQVLKRESR